MSVNIAIDGPASAGKAQLQKWQRSCPLFVDTGTYVVPRHLSSGKGISGDEKNL